MVGKTFIILSHVHAEGKLGWALSLSGGFAFAGGIYALGSPVTEADEIPVSKTVGVELRCLNLFFGVDISTSPASLLRLYVLTLSFTGELVTTQQPIMPGTEYKHVMKKPQKLNNYDDEIEPLAYVYRARDRVTQFWTVCFVANTSHAYAYMYSLHVVFTLWMHVTQCLVCVYVFHVIFMHIT